MSRMLGESFMQVLVADDDSFSRTIMEVALTKWGYEVISASDGGEALRVLSAKRPPSLAVLDWMMPGIEGIEIVREVRRLQRQSYTYMILVTGRREKDDIILGLEAGADDYVVKPVHAGELRARIRCGQRIAELQSELIAARNLQEMINRDLFREIGERERIEGVLARAKQEWERTFDTVPDLIAIIDSDHKIVRLNKSMADKFGAHPRDIVGKACYTLCHGREDVPSFCPLVRMLWDGKEQVAEIVEERWGGCFMVSVTPMYDEFGQITGCVHVARDVTEKRLLEDRLTRLASHDPLTELPNRRYFLETLSLLFENSKRYGHPLSVGILDVDFFKQVNDANGHQAGDDVLKRLAEIMRAQLRSGDVAGRYGGDEFVIAFSNTGVAGATESMERIRQVLERIPFEGSSGPYHVSCTGGVAELVQGHLTREDLIHTADMVLYEAKNQGRNQIVAHDRTLCAQHPTPICLQKEHEPNRPI